MRTSFCWRRSQGALRNKHKPLTLLKVCNNNVADLYNPGAPYEHGKKATVKPSMWFQDQVNKLLNIEDLNFQSTEDDNILHVCYVST